MQGDSATIDLTMVIIRGITLTIAALSGMLAIYLGWKLYREGLVSAVTAEASKSNSWAFKMRAMGPGVFFALFGMALLIYVIRQEMTIEGARVLSGAPAEIQAPKDTAQQASPPSALPSEGSGKAGAPCLPRPAPVSEPLRRIERPNAPSAPRSTCLLQERNLRRFSDGSTLSPNRIRTALASADRLLAKLDRSTLTLEEQSELQSTRDTFDRMKGALQ